MAELESQTEIDHSKAVTIKGNRFLHWFYGLLYRYYSKKAKSYEEKHISNSKKTFQFKEIRFESPRLLIVMFTNLETKQDYEVSLHHESAYVSAYEEYQKTKEIPKHFRINEFIKSNYKKAIKV